MERINIWQLIGTFCAWIRINWSFFSDVEHLQWVHTPKDADIAIAASLQWECKALGNPRPAYRWLKNGQILAQEVRTARRKRRKSCISSSIIRCIWVFTSVIECATLLRCSRLNTDQAETKHSPQKSQLLKKKKNACKSLESWFAGRNPHRGWKTEHL